MKRKLVIEITTDDVAENTGFNELMDNLQDYCQEQANELVAIDGMEHGYFFSVVDPEGKNNVHIDSHWEQE